MSDAQGPDRDERGHDAHGSRTHDTNHACDRELTYGGN